MVPVHVRRLGRTSYSDVHALQQELLTARLDGTAPDTLLLTEHERVVTLGRGSPRGAQGDTTLPVFEVERGGEATWHGPGQLVAYPILLLPETRRDLHRYLRDLEEVVIGVLADHGVRGARVEGRTGVWTSGRKLCSIGVAVRRWTTWHGLALNVTNDLADFHAFAPCGLDPNVMTRLVDHAPHATMETAERSLLVNFTRVFGVELDTD